MSSGDDVRPRQMECIVLCAGFATRLGALAAERPKHLLPVGGRPMVEWLLDRLAEAGFARATLVTNAAFAPRFATWLRGAETALSVRLLNDGARGPTERLGSVGDLAFALDKLDSSGPFFVANGDNVFTFSLPPLLAAFDRQGSTIALYDVGSRDLVRKAGEAQLDAQGRVSSFVEKPTDPSGTCASIGLYVFRPRVRDLIARYVARGGPPDRTGDLIAWLHSVEPLYGWRAPSDGLWFDVGTPDQYRAADGAFRGRLRPRASRSSASR